MAVTEITKILFRRGSAEDRASLESFGGLAQGEPGFTVEGNWSGAGSTPTRYDIRSAYLRNEDVVSYTGFGDTANENGGGDLFIGGSEGADIYIGGSSAEKHYQRYFVSLRGTGYNTSWGSDTGTSIETNGFIDGQLIVGKPDGKTSRTDSDEWNVIFYSHNAGADPAVYNGNKRAMWWRPADEALEIWSNTALKIPVGTTQQRPGSGDFVNYQPLTGMIRYNTTNLTYEGFDGITWSNLGGVMSTDKCTYITPQLPAAPDGDGQFLGAADELTFVTGCLTGANLDANGIFTTRGDVISNGVNLNENVVRSYIRFRSPGTNGAVGDSFIDASSDANNVLTRNGGGNYTFRTAARFKEAPVVVTGGSGRSGFTGVSREVTASVGPFGAQAFDAVNGTQAEIQVLQPYSYHAGSAKDGDDYWATAYADSAAAVSYAVPDLEFLGLSSTDAALQSDLVYITGLYEDKGNTRDGFNVYENVTTGSNWTIHVQNGRWTLSNSGSDNDITAGKGFIKFGVHDGDTTNDPEDTVFDTVFSFGNFTNTTITHGSIGSDIQASGGATTWSLSILVAGR